MAECAPKHVNVFQTRKKTKKKWNENASWKNINNKKKSYCINDRKAEEEWKKCVFNSTYCHVKLPVMPSFRRSRRERCRLGPEPTGGIAFAPFDDDDDVILLKMDSAVGLPDEVVCAAVEWCCSDGLSSFTESNDDSSGKNVLMAVPLPPLMLQLAAELPPIILLIVYFLRVWWLGDSLNEPCFGEQSRDDDMFACFLYRVYFARV